MKRYTKKIKKLNKNKTLKTANRVNTINTMDTINTTNTANTTKKMCVTGNSIVKLCESGKFSKYTNNFYNSNLNYSNSKIYNLT